MLFELFRQGVLQAMLAAGVKHHTTGALLTGLFAFIEYYNHTAIQPFKWTRLDKALTANSGIISAQVY